MRRLTLALGLLLPFLGHAQYETVVLNYEKSYFGENAPLPAGRYFMLTGTVPSAYPYVEVLIYEARGKEGRKPLHQTNWKRDLNNQSPSFNIPINYALKEGHAYDVLFNFYRPISERERAALAASLFEALDLYSSQSIQVDGKRLGTLRRPSQMMDDMARIVTEGMALYRHRTRLSFAQFSDIVRLQLEQLDELNLPDTPEGRAEARQESIIALQRLLHNEAGQFLGGDLYVLADDKYIEDYQSERLTNAYYLQPHFGYGGVALAADGGNFDYASQMYAGISFPLAASNSPSLFLSRSSISVGAWLGNLENREGQAYSGPLFGVPTYAAYGYRAFSFFRLQAGATFMQAEGDDSAPVLVRPFVGLSAELNLWFNFGK